MSGVAGGQKTLLARMARYFWASGRDVGPANSAPAGSSQVRSLRLQTLLDSQQCAPSVQHVAFLRGQHAKLARRERGEGGGRDGV